MPAPPSDDPEPQTSAVAAGSRTPDAPDPIPGARAQLFAAVAALRASVRTDPGRSRREGRAQDDPFWPVLTAVFCRFLAVWDPRVWDGGTVDALLYALARDEGAGVLRREIAARPASLAALAEAGLGSGERDARTQLVDALAAFAPTGPALGEAEVRRLLATYAGDEEAPVRQRALLALAERDRRTRLAGRAG